MTLNLDREVRVVALVRALTKWVTIVGYGGFLADPEARHIRARLYTLAGIEDWSAWEDREAAVRFKIWHREIREQEAVDA